MKKIVTSGLVILAVGFGAYPMLAKFSPVESNIDVMHGLLDGRDPGVPILRNQNLTLEQRRISNNEIISIVSLAVDVIDPENYKERVFRDYYKAICENQQFLKILDRGINFGYIYTNTLGKQMFYLNLRKNTCLVKMQWGKTFDFN